MLRVLPRNGFFLSKGLASTKAAASSEPIPKSTVNLELFESIKSRIHGSGQAIDKIVIKVLEANGSKREILVNRNSSTPYTCSKHTSYNLSKHLALAAITYPSGAREIVSPVSRITQPCEVRFIDFTPAENEIANLVNQAFWRSSSILLAAVLKDCFPELLVKPNVNNVKSLYFSAIVNNLIDELSQSELKELEFCVKELIKSDVQFDTIIVSDSVATEYGLEPGTHLARLNNFVCKVDGPVICSPSQISKFKIIGAKTNNKSTIVASIALPRDQSVSAFYWDLIYQSAQKNFNL